MSLSKERILAIESLTMDLLREAYGENEDIIPPIDLNKIIEKAGLNIMDWRSEIIRILPVLMTAKND